MILICRIIFINQIFVISYTFCLLLTSMMHLDISCQFYLLRHFDIYAKFVCNMQVPQHGLLRYFFHFRGNLYRFFFIPSPKFSIVCVVCTYCMYAYMYIICKYIYWKETEH